MCSGHYGFKSELHPRAFESEGCINVLFGSVAGICQGQEEADGQELISGPLLLLLMKWPKIWEAWAEQGLPELSLDSFACFPSLSILA